VDLELNGKRAIVTGASKGIGRAIAAQLAAEGCRLIVVARGESELRAAARRIADDTGAQVEAVVADTADAASVTGMVRAAVEQMGGVDILVNSAASSAGATGTARAVSPEKLAAELDIKALGYLRCSQAVAPTMVEQGWGRIINVAGLAARQSGSISATMRNAAVIALTKTLADELGRHGINVTAVNPGTTRTERIATRIAARAGELALTHDEVAAEMALDYAIGRLVEPREVAYLVAFLASPLSVAITGDAIACGGGRIGSVYY
jgi:NAD(P)-dependent dehydrogenase (short-subunit alcohol dehydrogenase family)